MLAQAGVHPKTAQELARHSTITLTMDHYTHVSLYDLGAAVGTLPALPEPKLESEKATGTDGRKMVAGMVAGVNGNHSDSVRPVEAQATYRAKPKTDVPPKEEPLALQGVKSDCDPLRPIEKPVPEAGLEPARGLPSLDFESSARNPQPVESQGSCDDAPDVVAGMVAKESQISPAEPATALADLDLARIVTAWPALPEAVKAGIVAMVEAATCV